MYFNGWYFCREHISTTVKGTFLKLLTNKLRWVCALFLNFKFIKVLIKKNLYVNPFFRLNYCELCWLLCVSSLMIVTLCYKASPSYLNNQNWCPGQTHYKYRTGVQIKHKYQASGIYLHLIKNFELIGLICFKNLICVFTDKQMKIHYPRSASGKQRSASKCSELINFCVN